MYRVLDESCGRTVGIEVDGTLTKDDYEVLIPYLENLINECGALNLLCELTQWSGVDVLDFGEGFMLRIRHLPDFQRIAIVGDH